MGVALVAEEALVVTEAVEEDEADEGALAEDEEALVEAVVEVEVEASGDEEVEEEVDEVSEVDVGRWSRLLEGAGRGEKGPPSPPAAFSCRWRLPVWGRPGSRWWPGRQERKPVREECDGGTTSA